jgi:hypothetical protein
LYWPQLQQRSLYRINLFVLNGRPYALTFRAVWNTRTDDEVLVFHGGIEISARVDLTDMRGKRAVSLVEMVFGAGLRVRSDQIIEVVVPVGIGGQNGVVLGRAKENRGSLNRDIIVLKN